MGDQPKDPQGDAPAGPPQQGGAPPARPPRPGPPRPGGALPRPLRTPKKTMIGGSLPVRPAPGAPAPPQQAPAPAEEQAPTTLRRGQTPSAAAPVPTSKPAKSKFSSTVAFEASPDAQQQLADALGVPDSAPQPQPQVTSMNSTVAFGAMEEPAPNTPRGLGGEGLKETAPETPYGRQVGTSAPSRGKSKFSSTMAFEASPDAQQQLDQALQQGSGAATRAFDAIPASSVEPAPAAPAANQLNRTVAFTGGDDIAAAQAAAATPAPSQVAPQAQAHEGSAPRMRKEKSHLSSTIAFESADVQDVVAQAHQIVEAKGGVIRQQPPPQQPPPQQAQPQSQQSTKAFAAAPSAPGEAAAPAGSPHGTAGPTRTGRSHLSSTLAFIPQDDMPLGAKRPLPAAGQPAPPAQPAPAAQPPPQAAPPMQAAPPPQAAPPMQAAPQAPVIDVSDQAPADPTALQVDPGALFESAEAASKRAATKKKPLSSKKRTMLGGVGDLGAEVDQARADYAAAQSAAHGSTDLGLGQQPGMPPHGTDLGVGPPAPGDMSLAQTMASPSPRDQPQQAAVPGPPAGTPVQAVVPGELAPPQQPQQGGYPPAPTGGYPPAPAMQAGQQPEALAAPAYGIPGQAGLAPDAAQQAPQGGYPPAPGAFAGPGQPSPGMGPGMAPQGMVQQPGMPMAQPGKATDKKLILIVVGVATFVVIVAVVIFLFVL